MASGIDRRLDKVEAGLSPQQAVLRWLQQAHQFGTVRAYSRSLKDLPFERYPRCVIPKQVSEAVRGAMPPKAKPQAVSRAERKAVREVAFLLFLVHECNMRLWGDWRAMGLQLGFVALEMKGLMEDDAAREAQYEEARQHAIDAVAELLQWQIALEKVTERYFGGTSPIFPTQAHMLAEMVEHAEFVATKFNEHLAWMATYGAKNKRGKVVVPTSPIDLAGRTRELLPAGVELARHIVVMAKVEASRFMGETHEALGILRARLWPEK
jgi:hypothetical protein